MPLCFLLLVMLDIIYHLVSLFHIHRHNFENEYRFISFITAINIKSSTFQRQRNVNEVENSSLMVKLEMLSFN